MPQPISRQAKLDEARGLMQRQEWAAAAAILEPLVRKPRPSAEVLFYLALVHEAQTHLERAQELGERSMKISANPNTALLLARVYRIRGETEKALASCDRALKLAPGTRPAIVTKAGALEEAGRAGEAFDLLEPLVNELEGTDVEPPTLLLTEWAKVLVQKKRSDEAIEVIDRAVERPDIPDQNRCMLLHLKAKALDRSKDFPAAHGAASKANEIGRLEFDADLYSEQVETLMEHWSREKMERFPLSACRSEVPVFVAGMPRSGTSLIDQIIDAHPRAAGVGELATIDTFARQLASVWDADLEPPQSFGRFNDKKWTQVADKYVREVQKLAPGAERIVNKSLGNNRLVGLIARLFPKTRIIHAIRDPRDVSISCFMGGFNNALHPWTTRIEWAAKAWEQSMRMMEHWKETLDVPILDVHYENLVRDPEHEFPRIIEFLGLEWDDACRDFHKSRRTVRTLSYDQVNRPIYTSSAGRHANYAEQIEGIDFPEYAPTGRA